MAPRRVINCITTRTDAEWPPDHPLRRYADSGVMTNADFSKFKVEEIALVCQKPGEKRLPCPPDDRDDAASCFKCGCDLVKRASANPAWRCVCFDCWGKMQ